MEPHFNVDKDGDEKPDENEMNQTNNNGVCTMNCDIDDDGWPEKNIDINNDGKCEINCYNNQGVCTKNCISGDDKMQIIAPRSYGEYSYSVKNTTKKVIRYNISYAEDNVYNINLLYRVKRNGLYITGWKKASEIKFNEMNLPSGKTDNYVLEWYWKDSENDTSIGELDAATYTITINVTAKGE